MANVIYEKASETAKKVRVELKKAFPGVKFSVKSSSYAGGSSIRVSWTDGPTRERVKAITSRFESASFDGMNDMKSYKNYEYEGQLYSGADYIFVSPRLKE